MSTTKPRSQAADSPLPRLRHAPSSRREGAVPLPCLEVEGQESIASILRLLTEQGLERVQVEIVGQSGTRLLKTDELHTATALGAGARPIRLMAGGFPPRSRAASSDASEAGTQPPSQPGPTRRQKKPPLWQQLAPTLAFAIRHLRSDP